MVHIPIQSESRAPEPVLSDRHPFDVIAAFAARLRAATVQQERSGRLDDCEQVIRARLDLAYCLMQSGWRPNQQVADTLRQDELLLAEGNGSLDSAEPVTGRRQLA